MKKFIIRNPFVSKASKAAGYQLLRAVETLVDVGLENDIDAEQRYKLMLQAGILMNKGAKYCGFRNAADMVKWFEQHPDKKIGPF